MAILIGVTGSFGSGKTTVAKMFAQRGAYIIDADKVCYSLMAPPGEVYKRIVRSFGESILKNDRTIDRERLSRIVFKDRSKLKLLNKIVHPAAIKEINRIIRMKKKIGFIVVDAALLVESGFYKRVDRLVVVRSNRDEQISRIIRSKGLTRKDILTRIGTQAPLKEKLALADFIIDNSASRKQTEIQVEKIWKTIRGGLCQ